MTKTELDLCRKLAGLWSRYPKHGDTYLTQIDTTYFVCEDTDIFSLSDIEKSTSVLVPTIEDLLGILRERGFFYKVETCETSVYGYFWKSGIDAIIHEAKTEKLWYLGVVIAVLSEQKEGG